MANEQQPKAVAIPDDWLEWTEEEQDEWVTAVLESFGLGADD